MLLERLYEYAIRPDVAGELPPTGYGPMMVRWLITIDADGMCQYVMDMATEKKGRGARGTEMMMPDVKRTSGIEARLLADNAEYAVGLGDPEGDAAKTADRHADFVNKVRECDAATHEPNVRAVLRFLDGLPQTWQGKLPEAMTAGDFITFEVETTVVADIPAVQAHWGTLRRREFEEGQPELVCLVCRKQKPVLDIIPFPVKGIPGGNTSGTALISANENAYESYGLKNSHHAPLCYECAEKTHRGLNHLLAGSRNVWRGRDMIYTAWTTGDGFDIFDILAQPDPNVVVALLKSVANGNKQALAADASRLYALSLSASAARAVIRDWIDTTVQAVKTNAARYFSLQRIVDLEGGECPPFGVYALAASVVREGADISPQFINALFMTAMHGQRLPEWALQQAVQRIRVEHQITRPRAALIKMALTQLLGLKEDALVSLDVNYPDQSYHCGRLLAVLERLQEEANGHATLVGRHFGSVATAPATGFPTLNRLAQAHLAKLRRDDRKRPAAIAIEQRIMEIKEQIGTLPTLLSLREQGVFDLGYWHQKAHDRAAAREATRRKKGQSAGTETDTVTV